MTPFRTLRNFLLSAMLAVVLTPCPLAAFDAGMQWGGHLKALGDLRWPEAHAFPDVDPPAPLTDGTLEFRLTQLTSLPWAIDLETHYEAICHGGDGVRNARMVDLAMPGTPLPLPLPDPDRLDRRRLMDLTATLDTGSSHICYHRLDRLNLTVLPDWGMVRVGRQAVTWGDGFVFNPMDLFNPFAPTDIERDYKTGDDMALTQVLFENGDDLQALVAPRRDPETGDVSSDHQSLAVKAHIRIGGRDLDLMASRHYRDVVGGWGLSGYAGDAAWRINATWTDLDHPAARRDDYLSLVANVDFSWVWWQHNFYGFVEYYFNGLGDTDYPAALADPAVVERIDRGELFVLGKNYLTGQLQAEVHPLFNLFFNVILNAADPSAVMQAWGQWDAAENLRVVVGAKLAAGADGTEFGGFDLPETGIRIGVADTVYSRITLFF
ncbi:hypothetical protein DSCA_10320 [Desulfosarcina alkanivorans]|uniref:Alginate export domain-containing protein n=1 Tax=Desulfosarcina alkanivorans TaxID=571177 RepID=A0A5K7YCE9_9BACT|nr:hypothetical protein [Desulfosarcina alkanivorans]BBO67102.1 hypothetical protein DSCA_10320 [Desulfosarcina alkanivorans]